MPSLQMQYLNVTLLCETEEKKKSTKFDSHTGTKGSRHQKYHSYRMGLFKFTSKSDVLKHLEKKSLCNKQKCT